jgi:hypothetical protein
VGLYQLHRCVFDFLRAGAVPSRNSTVHFDPSRYDLTPGERIAFDTRDVAQLYRLGLHPVLLNAFCRATGLSRAEYRSLLAPLAVPDDRQGRWRT